MPKITEKNYFKNCPRCGKEQGYKHRACRDRAAKLNRLCGSCSNREKATGKTHTAEHKANMLAAKQKKRDACTEMYGEKSSLSSGHGKIKKWAKAVKTRDSYTCVRCDTVGSGQHINAHHIVPKAYFAEKAFDISNGITLCNSCHKNLHADLDRITLEGIKLTQVGFQDHAKQFIADGQASSQTTQNPHGYKPVFKPMITSHKE